MQIILVEIKQCFFLFGAHIAYLIYFADSDTYSIFSMAYSYQCVWRMHTDWCIPRDIWISYGLQICVDHVYIAICIAIYKGKRPPLCSMLWETQGLLSHFGHWYCLLYDWHWRHELTFRHMHGQNCTNPHNCSMLLTCSMINHHQRQFTVLASQMNRWRNLDLQLLGRGGLLHLHVRRQYALNFAVFLHM